VRLVAVETSIAESVAPVACVGRPGRWQRSGLGGEIPEGGAATLVSEMNPGNGKVKEYYVYNKSHITISFSNNPAVSRLIF
jgi:hypothetical protein